MAYSEYKQAYFSLGIILYALHKMGIPLRIVESVIYSGEDRTLEYCGHSFAKVEWTELGTPVFESDPDFKSYQPLQDVANTFDSSERRKGVHQAVAACKTCGCLKVVSDESVPNFALGDVVAFTALAKEHQLAKTDALPCDCFPEPIHVITGCSFADASDLAEGGPLYQVDGYLWYAPKYLTLTSKANDNTFRLALMQTRTLASTALESDL